MISLTTLKYNMLQIIRLMIQTGMYVDFVYKGNLYRLRLEDLNETVVKRRRPRKKPSLVEEVAPAKCPQCGKLQINDICMNSNCPRNAR